MERLPQVKHPLSYSFQPGSVCKVHFAVFVLFRAMLDNAVNTFRLLPQSQASAHSLIAS